MKRDLIQVNEHPRTSLVNSQVFSSAYGHLLHHKRNITTHILILVLNIDC